MIQRICTQLHFSDENCTNYYFLSTTVFYISKQVNRKVQGVSQSQTAANPQHQQKRKMTKTNTYKAIKQMHEKHTDHLPLSPSEVITMQKRIKKHEDREHGKTLKNEAPRSINHKATQNKSNTGTIALERSVA